MKALLVSACLLGENCKYNGGNNKLDDDIIARLGEKYRLIAACPEILGGLDAPRFPCEIKNSEVVNSNGEILTANFVDGANKALELARLNACGKALLKERSPSCGYGEIYDGTFSHRIISGNGICAGILDSEGIHIFGESKLEQLLK